MVNLGGFGLGTGTLVPDAIVGRGGQGEAVDERIAARAIVFGQKKTAIAIADIETQGMFAAYEDGPYGLTTSRRPSSSGPRASCPRTTS